MITQEELKLAVHYDPDTGIFTRLISTSSRAKRGMVIGTPTGLGGHLRATVCGRRYYLQQLAWLYMTGEIADEVDHIDLDAQNNKWENLRNASRVQNSCNRLAPSQNTSGVKGVTWDKQTQKWRAQLHLHGRHYCFGRHVDKDDAIVARMLGAERLHGEFARG
jgi:hypothetical protein